MPRTSLPRLWSTVTLAGQRFQLLNLDHPQIAARILGDLEAGIAVYYDRRWDITTRFGRFLLAHPELAAKMGEQGHEHVRENFLVTQNLKTYLLLFLALQRR